MKFDYLIIGSGFSGSVLAERIANELGKTCLVVDKRNHIGGNCYDYYDNNDILIHKYGPHIFHTQMQKVWDYLSRFTEWRPYEHKVLAEIEGKNVPVPFNFNSLHALFPKDYAEKMEKLLTETYGAGLKIPILKMQETKNADLKFLADYIYQNIFLGYNLKQWELKPEELDPTVSSRVPVHLSRDDRYFQDQFQAMPLNGYTKIFEKMLSNKKIKILLNTDYKEVVDYIKFDKLIFTGPLDQFFNYEFGRLPYRSLTFDLQTYNQEVFQEVAQLNYPNQHDYTRATEFKHLTGQEHKKTTVAYEYSYAYQEGINEPYYPIPKSENAELYEKYKKEADKLQNVIFLGRLADYKYYNMDQTIGVALQTFEKKIAKG